MKKSMFFLSGVCLAVIELLASAPVISDEKQEKESMGEATADRAPSANLRKDLDFMLKPGSGWIIGGASLLTLGVPTLLFGSIAAVQFFMINSPFGFVCLAPGLALTITGGAVFMAIGTSIAASSMAFVAHPDDTNAVAVLTSVGGVFFSYGLGFLLCGALTDFKKETERKTALQKAASSLSPYFSCTGGSCDGYTNRTTGREAYVGGLRGEF